ncbi:hypothetical protein OQJ18_00820 [Fluoribacter dumoffii]|uniref:Uncharacterized protein n=1 Tax=Fluoribacter dumoffii TaxID=463 RepID=A0A377GDB1_9GAMM|nr:hypothetical protein [Fluoribacter dumoffii]KTC90608.1 hypothetical protein Ldum_1676 [Fluoribacter dumoffii NY 23]MCW8386287.1 hypothetical protein [Fluoribacter dumoffii]MCW8419340.1 hypothetical protein [Fluoribacter dumoffii]MCW8452785.1 hypothetical protein [Fluoribacter dumoffii]MCW8459965.1 hypothetical protein [Fluoribacter dumoffii]
MEKSRRQILAQIEQMDRTLRSEEYKVAEHQAYFAQSQTTRYYLAAVLLLVSAFFIGWKMERKQWSGKIMQQVIDVVVLAMLNSLKKTTFTLFK